MFGLFPETPAYRGASQTVSGSAGSGGLANIARVFGDTTPAYRGAAPRPDERSGCSLFAGTPAYRTATPPEEPPAEPPPAPPGEEPEEPPAGDDAEPTGEDECDAPILLDRGTAIRTRVPVTIFIQPNE